MSGEGGAGGPARREQVFRLRWGPGIVRDGDTLVLRAVPRELFGWLLVLPMLGMGVLLGLFYRENPIGVVIGVVLCVVTCWFSYRNLVHPRLVVRHGIVTVHNPVRRVSFPVGEIKKVRAGMFQPHWYEKGSGWVISIDLRSKVTLRVFVAQTVRESSALRLRAALDRELRSLM